MGSLLLGDRLLHFQLNRSPTRCSGSELNRNDSESLHAEFGGSFRLIESRLNCTIRLGGRAAVPLLLLPGGVRLFKDGEVIPGSVGRAGEVGVEGDKAETTTCDLIDQNLLRKKVSLHVIVPLQSEGSGTVDHSEAAARLHRVENSGHHSIGMSELVEYVDNHDCVER